MAAWIVKAIVRHRPSGNLDFPDQLVTVAVSAQDLAGVESAVSRWVEIGDATAWLHRIETVSHLSDDCIDAEGSEV